MIARITFPSISTFLFLTLTLLLTTNCRTLNFTNYKLSKYNVEHNWQQIDQILTEDNDENVSKLVINENCLNVEAFKKLLAHDRIKGSVRDMEITTVVLNQQLLTVLFQSEMFPELVSLDLSQTNIEDDDLALIPAQKQLKLEQLKLENNFIGEIGFKHLLKAKMNNIKRLELYGVSLVKDAAVENLLGMNLSKLKGIGLGFTAISGENVIKILKNIKVQQLQSLNLTRNNFGPTFYKNLSQLNFSALKNLDLSDLVIDQTAVAHLNNMKFPELTTLSIGSNQIFINGLYTFLSRKNYPKLNKLIINSVIFQEQFFKFLVQQFHDTNFQTLQFSGDGIPPQIFFYLNKLSTKSLKILTVRNGYVKAQLLSNYFNNNQFPELEQLDMSDVQNGRNVLQMFMSKKGKWNKVRVLKIARVDTIDYGRILREVNGGVFPVLENLGIDARSLNYTQVQKLIETIAKSTGKLANLNIIVNQAQKILRQLASGSYRSIHKQLYLTLMTMKWSNQYKQLTITARMMLNPNDKPTIYTFGLEGLLQVEYTNMLVDLDAPTEHKQTFQKKVDWRAHNYIRNAKQFYLNGFQYDMDHLVEGTYCYMLEYFVSKAKNQSKQCVLPSIVRLQLLNITDQCYQYFNQCFFPNLGALQSIFFDNFTTNATNFTLFPNPMPELVYMLFTKQDNMPNTKIHQMFHRQNLTQLNTLIFQFSDLNSNDFIKLLKINPYMRRLRSLLTIQTAIQDLSFYSEFNMKLRKVVLNAELIGQYLFELQNISFEWVRVLRMVYAGITNEQFINFLQQISKKSQPAFPQMQQCYFPANYIESTGTKKLFQVGTPTLNQLNFIMNRDPNIINTILGSPNSHRIRKLSFYQNNQDSIDPDLNPKNTREIVDMIVSSQKLQKSDFKALSHMDFRRLHHLTVFFTKFFQCETFNYLVKIAENVKVLALDFPNSIQNQLNSNCLTSSPTSDQNLKHLSAIMITTTQFQYSNLQKFFNLLIFDQILERIVLQGVYPSEKAFRRMVVQSNLQYLTMISLNFNDLTDSMVSELLNRDFPQLLTLDLGNNPRLTSKCLQKMKNRTYYSLRHISLARTSITDEAIEILITLDLPYLQALSFQSTDITPYALELLSKLKAPFLNAIDLSLNNLSADDLMRFSPDRFIHLQQIKLMPFMKVKDKAKLQQYFNKNRKKYSDEGQDRGQSLIQIKADILNYDEEDQQGVNANNDGDQQFNPIDSP